ncbi:uncharacterized protein B0H64DRAFT_189570 [Chaetomium fimeti]|uniref:Uncharacterized protein n=1 Tax=Chaetomium fimeti TaxID=1854472 RepID=A0AAE0HDI4_9PEZI|nr:hypothetical protein B0H64DRAFT_189570 [Chaetomium fimeti]
MAILIPEPDVNGRVRASIEESAARYAEVGRLLASVGHHVDMPLLQNPEEDPLPCREAVEETTAVSAHFSAQIPREKRSLAGRGKAGADRRGKGCRGRNHETLPTLPFIRKLRIVQGAGSRYDQTAAGISSARETTAEDEAMDEQWDEDPQGGEEVDFFPDMFRTEPLAERVEPLLSGFPAAVKNMGAPSRMPSSLPTWRGILPKAGQTRTETGRRTTAKTACIGGGCDTLLVGMVEWSSVQVGDWRRSQTVLDLFGDLGRQEWLDFEFGHKRHIKPYTGASVGRSEGTRKKPSHIPRIQPH